MNDYNLTPRVQKIISISKQTSRRLNSHDVCLNHLLHSILDCDQSTIVNFFRDLNIPIDDFKIFVFNEIDSSPIETGAGPEHIDYCKDFKKVFKLAKALSKKLSHNYIGVEHVFYIMLTHKSSPLQEFLSRFHVDIDKAKKKLDYFFKTGEWSQKRVQKTF